MEGQPSGEWSGAPGGPRTLTEAILGGESYYQPPRLVIEHRQLFSE